MGCRTFVWLALALAAASCSSSKSAPADAGTLSSCSSDAECASGFQCDRDQRRCVCTGDSACPGGFCNAFTGTCVASVPGCTSNASCSAGDYCDRGLRSCKTLTSTCGSCKTDDQCGAGSSCAAHPNYPNAGTFCVPQCGVAASGDGGTTDAGSASCPTGLSCLARDATPNAQKLCYPSTGACGVSNACSPDSRKPCSADADCADSAQTCDQTLKACVAKVQTCPAGDVCDPAQRICVQSCATDSDCLNTVEHKPGYKCSAGVCVLQDLCSVDSNCSKGQYCQPNADGSSSCRTSCVTNADCPLGNSCSTVDPNHAKCAQGCSASTDCPLNQICSSGACVSSTSTCTQACQQTQVCNIASSCSASNCCSAANLSQACPTSTAQNSVYPCTQCDHVHGCPAPLQFCAQNCFPLTFKTCSSENDCLSYPGTHCTPSGFCQQMVWVQPCTSDSDCPYKGFVCRASSQFCGSGGGASAFICIPDAQSAQIACLNGHL